MVVVGGCAVAGGGWQCVGGGGMRVCCGAGGAALSVLNGVLPAVRHCRATCTAAT